MVAGDTGYVWDPRVINGGRTFIVDYPGRNQMEEPLVSREDFMPEEEARYKTTRRHVTDYGGRNDTDCEPVVVNIRCTREKPSSTQREYSEVMRDKPRGGPLREENNRRQCSAQCPDRRGANIMAGIAQVHKDQTSSLERQPRYRSEQTVRRSQPHREVMRENVRPEREEHMPYNVRPERPMHVQDDEKEVDNVDNKGGRLSVDALNITIVPCSRVHSCCR